MSEINNEKIQQKIDQVKARFEERIEKIKKEGAQKINEITDDSPDPNGFEAVLDATFDVKWKNTSIKFDIPKFSMEREIIKFHIPEVRMELKSIKFDVPAVRMVRTCLFKKPEITVKGIKVYTKMTCVYGDKPETYMKTIEIKTDIPKFTSKLQEISFDKPVVRMETTEIILKLPQFYLKKISTQIEQQENEIEDVSQDMSAKIALAEKDMQMSLQSEIAQEISKMNDEIGSQLLAERENVCSYYDDAIAKTKAAIKSLKENNAIDEVASLENELSKIIEDYKTILNNIDEGLTKATIPDLVFN